jgi:hypothetical protein
LRPKIGCLLFGHLVRRILILFLADLLNAAKTNSTPHLIFFKTRSCKNSDIFQLLE